MRRKAQVTLFIILGIIVLSAVIGVTVYMTTNAQTNIPGSVNVIENENEEEEQQIRTFVDECLERIVPEGLEIMRLQGGWINFPIGVETLQIQSDYTIFTDGVKQIKKEPGNISVPIYLTSDGLTGMPTLLKMQKELEGFTTTNLLACLNEFEEFENEDAELTLQDIEVDVTFALETIVEVTSPILLERSGQSGIVDRFIYSIPVNMRKMYWYAEQLTELEIQNTYLEEFTMRLVSLYSYRGGQRGADDLPPTVLPVTNFDCDTEEWPLVYTQNLMKKVIEQNIEYLTIGETIYNRPIADTEIGQATFDSFHRKYFLPDNTTSILLDFKYDWPTEIDVRPRDGNIIRPDSNSQRGIPFLPVFCNIDYNFKYDIQYPVLFTVKDFESTYVEAPHTITGELGSEFLFAIETFVVGNQDRVYRENPYRRFDDSLNLGENRYRITGQLCEEDDAPTLEVKVFDDRTNLPIEDANVQIFCGGQFSTCQIGATDDNGLATGNAPQCTNGLLLTSAENYKVERTTVTTAGIQPPVQAVSLKPLSELQTQAEIIYIDKFVEGYYRTNGYTTPACDDGATPETLLAQATYEIENNSPYDEIVTVTYIPTLPTTIPTAAILPSSQARQFHGEVYDVFSIYKAKVTINPSVYDTPDGPQVVDIGDSPIPGAFNQFRSDYVLGNSQYVWVINDEDLYDKSTITFRTFVDHLPWQTLEVKDVANAKIDANGNMKGRFNFDVDCDGQVDNQGSIPRANWEPFLEPKIS